MDFVDDDDSDQEYEPDFEEDEWSGGTVPWDSLDLTLVRLVQQAHNAENKLTLQLNIRCTSPDPFKPNRLLPKFLGCGGLVHTHCQGESTPIISLRL